MVCETRSGMLGFRLEVQAHIITGATTAIHNLLKCAQPGSGRCGRVGAGAAGVGRGSVDVH